MLVVTVEVDTRSREDGSYNLSLNKCTLEYLFLFVCYSHWHIPECHISYWNVFATVHSNGHSNSLPMDAREAYVLQHWNCLWVMSFVRVFVVVCLYDNPNTYNVEGQISISNVFHISSSPWSSLDPNTSPGVPHHDILYGDAWYATWHLATDRYPSTEEFQPKWWVSYLFIWRESSWYVFWSRMDARYLPNHRLNNDVSDSYISRGLPISNAILIPSTLDCNAIVSHTYVTILNQHIFTWICSGNIQNGANRYQMTIYKVQTRKKFNDRFRMTF